MKKLKFTLGILVSIIALNSCSFFGGKASIDLIPVKSGDDYGYIDREGKIVINPQFSEATIFREGLAMVKTSGKDQKYGYIDEKGSYIINPQYKYATPFSEGLAWVVLPNSAPTAIDTDGKVQITLQNAETVSRFHNGLAAFSTIDKEGKEKWGFVDKNGNIAINPQFDRVYYFADGKCAVKNDKDKWGFIDTSGKLIINYQFDRVLDFQNGYAIVYKDEKAGTIDAEGKFSINPQFENIYTDNKEFIINQGDKWGWSDNKGKIIINPQFSDLNRFNNSDLAPVKSGDSWGYINKEGKIIINPQFETAFSFDDDLALVSSSGKYGFVNKEGKYIINPQFDGIGVDYYAYISSEESTYESVSTDYFNVEAVVNSLNLEKPEGLDLFCTYKQIINILKIPESTFGRYGYETTVVNRKITSDVSINLSVFGSSYEPYEVTKSYGWFNYTDTEYRFVSSKKTEGFKYVIHLNGKGEGKAKLLIEAIAKNLKDYKKGQNSTTNMYYNSSKKLKFFISGNQYTVEIYITATDGSEIEDSNSKIIVSDNNSDYTDESEVAVDSVAVDTAVVDPY